MRRFNVALLASALCAALVLFAALRMNDASAEAVPKRFRTFTIDFNGRKCEFCGANAAEWFELSAKKSDGSVSAQYFCRECREFCRFK